MNALKAWSNRYENYKAYFKEPRRRARQAAGVLSCIQDNTRAIRPGHLLAFVELRNDQPRMAHEGAAERRQRRSLARAHEQGRVQLLLQLLDGGRQRGL